MLSALFAGTIFALSLSNVLAAVTFKGVNIAGFEFGVHMDGSCDISRRYGPYMQLRYGNNPDGAGQMIHFTSVHGFNMYRLPVSWQYLVNNKLGGTLDAKNFGDFDKLVQACLATGSHCLVDIHNFARWNGNIIGQGGPSNADFADVWSQLATKYASEKKIVFALMNEPHDMPDINAWGTTVQAAVTAIRKAGATSQMILMPGTEYTSAEYFISSGSAAALAKVSNLDGSTDNLIFDVHKYLDVDNSGSHSNCVHNNIDDAFAPLATWLRANNRQAILSETGGGNSDPSCLKYVCEALRFIDSNEDVYLGYLGWAAGSFSVTDKNSLTPFGDAKSGWTDQELLTKCFAADAPPSPPQIVAAKTFAAVQTPKPKPKPAVNVGVLGGAPEAAPKTTTKHHAKPTTTKEATHPVETKAAEPQRPSPDPQPAPEHAAEPTTTSNGHETKTTATTEHKAEATNTKHHQQHNHHSSSSGFSTATKPKATETNTETPAPPGAVATGGAGGDDGEGEDDTCEL